MPEESQLEDMRDAIRGDFRRLEERRGTQHLMRIADDPGDAAPAPEEADTRPGSGSWLDRLLGRRPG